MTEHTLSPLDQAHAHHLAGKRDAALRLGIACARQSPEAPAPIALLARILIDAGRTMLGAEVSAKLVTAFMNRGDLPGAVVASHLALDAGEEHAALLRAIAAGFAKDSPRLAQVGQAPPPLPTAPVIPDALARLEGEGLLDEAENVLTRYLSTDDSTPNDTELPTWPLFGDLSEDALLSLLKALRVEEVSGGHEVFRQGEEGREAFVVARGLLQVIRKQGDDETLLAQLGPSAIFGEMALLSAAPRNATVRTLEPSQLLVLAREDLEKAALESPEMARSLGGFCRARMEANLVRHARVLSGLPVPQRVALLRGLETRFFERGERVIKRLEDASHIYLVASGCLTVSLPDGDEQLVLATLGPGEVTGEIAMVLRRPATADVVAAHPTLAYELSRDQLKTLMREYPALLVELYELATRREDEVSAATEDGDSPLAVDDNVFV